MSSRDVSSSDLELARALSRRVSALAVSNQPLPTAPTVRYVRFSAARFAAPPAPPVSRVETAPQAPPEPSSFLTWSELLDWCLATSGATSAFVMEPQGFSIAQRGEITEDDVQGVGANLMLICARAERIEQPAGGLRSVSLEMLGGWLYTFRQPVTGSGPLLVAFMSPRELPDDVRATLQRLVERDAEHL